MSISIRVDNSCRNVEKYYGICLSFFFVALKTYSEKKQHKGEIAYFSSQFKVIVQQGRKSSQWEFEEAARIAFTVRIQNHKHKLAAQFTSSTYIVGCPA